MVYREKARFITIHVVAKEIGEELSRMLPAIHTAKGCDSIFSGIGKQTWTKEVETRPELIDGPKPLEDRPTEVNQKTKEAFVSLVPLWK